MEMPPRKQTPGPKNHVLDGGAHWRHLANMTEWPVRGGDAAMCQITSPACFYASNAFKSTWSTLMIGSVIMTRLMRSLCTTSRPRALAHAAHWLRTSLTGLKSLPWLHCDVIASLWRHSTTSLFCQQQHQQQQAKKAPQGNCSQSIS